MVTLIEERRLLCEKQMNGASRLTLLEGKLSSEYNHLQVQGIYNTQRKVLKSERSTNWMAAIYIPVSYATFRKQTS